MMKEDQESQVSPLAPSEIYLRSDDQELSTTAAQYHRPLQQKTSKLIVYILISCASFITLFVIFGSIFFIARTPKAKIRSVTITDLQANISTSSSANRTSIATLNMIMAGEITIDNDENFGRFELDNHKVSVIYENVSMGDGDVFGGNFKARKTASRNFTVEVRSNEYLSNNTNFRNEIESGLVQLTSYAQLGGRVHVTNIIKRHKTAILNCTMTLNLTGQAVHDLVCR